MSEEEVGPDRPRPSRSGRPRPMRRALKVGLAISVVVHLVLIGLYGWFFQEVTGPELDGTRPRATWQPQMELVPLETQPRQVPEVRSPETPSPDRPAERVSTEEVETAEAPGVEERIVTNAERLRPKVGDPRLWLPPVEGPLTELERMGHERAEAAVRALLQVYMDSLALSEEERRRAREWIVEGEGDERWGISPEGLHLGDVTIPLPVGEFFSQGGEQAREARRAIEDFNMIRQQAMDQEAAAVREERLKVMRERTREALEELRNSEDDSTSGSRDTSIMRR